MANKQAATARRWRERAKQAEKKLWRAESEIEDLKERIRQLEYQLSVGEEGALREEAAGYREMLTKEIDYGHRLRARINSLEIENRKLRAKLGGMFSPVDVFAGLIRVSDAIGPGMAWEEISKRECGE